MANNVTDLDRKRKQKSDEMSTAEADLFPHSGHFLHGLFHGLSHEKFFCGAGNTVLPRASKLPQRPAAPEPS